MIFFKLIFENTNLKSILNTQVINTKTLQLSPVKNIYLSLKFNSVGIWYISGYRMNKLMNSLQVVNDLSIIYV